MRSLRSGSLCALLVLAGCVAVAPPEGADESVGTTTDDITLLGFDCPPWAPWAGGCATALALPNVVTHHNDNSRTGWNHFERTLNTDDLRATQFGKRATWTVDGQIYAQPLFVSRGAGGRDLVIVATEHNKIYAFDADAEGDSPTPVWQRFLGVPYRVTPTDHPDVHNINVWPEMGITSTPVIDMTTRSIYAVSLQMGDHLTPRGTRRTFGFKVHELDLATGAVKRSAWLDPVAFTGPRPNDVKELDPRLYVQRAALLLSQGRIYVGFASNLGDEGYEWHGYLVAVDKGTLKPAATFITTPTTREGGVWQAGAGPAANLFGDVFVESGDGETPVPGDPPPPQEDSNSLLQLRYSAASGALTVASKFSVPVGYDNDFGSMGPMLIPWLPYVVSGGKDGVLFVHYQGALSPPVQQHDFDPRPPKERVPRALVGSPITWTAGAKPHVYVWPAQSTLHDFALSPFAAKPLGAPSTPAASPPVGWFGGHLAGSSDGSRAGTGVVWANATTGAEKGSSLLVAYDAANVTRELYRSTLDYRDPVTGSGRMSTPMVAAGRVYLATQEPWPYREHPTDHLLPAGTVPSGYVNVYGLLDSARDVVNVPPPPACVESSTPATGTWTEMYTKYFGPGSLGHCTSCHVKATSFSMASASSADVFAAFKSKLVTPGTTDPQKSQLGSTVAPPTTPLVWFNMGSMPKPEAPKCNPTAVRAVNDWLRAGAPGP